MTPIVKYLVNGKLPLDRVKARALGKKVVHSIQVQAVVQKEVFYPSPEMYHP